MSKIEITEDWDTFRHLVKIIQIIGELFIKNDHYEEILKKEIQANFLHRSKENSSESHTSSHSLDHQTHMDILSVIHFKDYLLEDNDRLKLNTLISIIESGRHL